MEIPKFLKVAIIAGDRQLANDVSCHLRKRRMYLPLFDLLTRKLPPKKSIEYSFFENDCIRIGNAIRHLQAQFIVLLGCKDDEISELKLHLPSNNLIIANSVDDVVLSKLPAYKKVPVCDQNLVFSPEKPPSGHIIAVEDNDNDMSKIIAKNLASSCNGSVVVIPKATDEELKYSQNLVREWTTEKHGLDRENAKNSLITLIKNKLSKLTSSSFESISFITRGIPYGVYPFSCPTTHYFSNRLLGLQVITGMMKPNFSYLHCIAAYLCDPNEFENSEFKQLRELFSSKKYVLRQSFGSDATVRDAMYTSQHLPLDFIFYSTHCGESEGRRIKERFKTSDGNYHEILYDSVVGFAPKPNSDLVQTTELQRWISIDGIPWNDQGNKIEAVNILREFEQFSRNRTNEEAISSQIENSDAGIVRYATVLKMSDFNFIPALNYIGGDRYPLVFNNACSSWQLARRYSLAGTSIYIGTTIDINNFVAPDVVLRFGTLITRGESVGYALFKAQKDHIFKNQYTPYLMHGYLFTKYLPFTPRLAIEEQFGIELKKSIDMWKLHEMKSEVINVKRNSSEIVLFLNEQLKSFFHEYSS